MKQILVGALVGALVQGALVFLIMFVISLTEGQVLHGPEPWQIAAFYGAGGAVLGSITGAIVGAILPKLRQ
jgi:hypothetical protein